MKAHKRRKKIAERGHVSSGACKMMVGLWEGVLMKMNSVVGEGHSILGIALSVFSCPLKGEMCTHLPSTIEGENKRK